MERKLCRFAMLTGVVALAAFAAVILAGAAYPDMLFQVLAPAGLLLSFLSCILFAAAWITSIIKAVRSKRYPYAAALLAVGLVVIFRAALRICRS